MSVKHAVLGLLVQRRGYGYDLVQRFEEQVGPAWKLNAGAIYVALDRLEQEGFVRPVAGDDDGRPVRRRTARGAPRVVYEATPEGVEHFEQWMARGTSLAPMREELHLKLALSRPRDLPRLLELTRELERSCRERLAQHDERRPSGELLDARAPWPAVAGALVRDAEVARLRATADWLSDVEAALRRLLERQQPAGRG